MNRTSWSLRQKGQIQLGDEKQPDGPSRIIPVKKEHLEDGILQLLASAADMQQRRDLDSALQLYEAAMEKVKSHGLNRKRLFTGTNKKPPPLNSRTPLEWSLHVGDMPSAICLLGGPSTALAELGTSGSLDQVRQILDAGASIEQRIGSFGQTFMLQEASKGNLNGVNLALERGASVHCMDDNGDTPLALALRCQHPQANLVVAALLAAGADVNAIDGKGQPLFKVTVAHGQLENVAQIMSALNPVTVEHSQIMRNWAASLPVHGDKWSTRDCSVLRFLLGHGLDPNLRLGPNKTSTMLDVAVQRQAAGSERLAAQLLKAGAKPNIEAALHGSTPKMLELILQNVGSLRETSQQPIIAWIASLHAYPQQWTKRDGEVLNLLLDFGLDPNIRRPAFPHPPLVVCAASYGDIDFLQRLIKNGADLGATDDNSDTAIIVAAKQKNKHIYDALKAAGVSDRYFLFGLGSVWTYYASS
ncbi:hypothetical protein HO173_001325 [Letharia columbiana]|uniref:Ankyrin repeat protein n=1 Tax=Letharia columbiana TaxID=112416 RepID=A0A8H6L9M2_9LECA|nr:uncharacterized protein HO173_001325 [Letharia columbiana]KAF6240653.1 hypothetical protein HO173_001325 [Letharia columbiana]